MKSICTRIATIAGLLSLGFFAACDLKEKLDITVPFSFGMEGSLNLTIPNSGLNASFELRDSLQIDTISEVKEYQDRIKAIRLKSVEFGVSDFSGNGQASLEGSLIFNGSFGSADAPFGPTNLQALSNAEEPLVLEFSTTEMEDISDALLAQEKLEIVFQGEASNPPVSFDYSLDFFMEIVANPLD